MMKTTDADLGEKTVDRYLDTKYIRLHYLRHAGTEPPLLLMPGLTANAHAFDGVVGAGVRRAVLAVDLRGRGLSDKPDQGYGMGEHAADIIGMLDEFGMDRAIVGGHSFGGILSVYLACHYPDRIEKIIIIDAAARTHPNTGEMVAPALSRLGRKWPSFSDFLADIKKAPYLKGEWYPEMERYYRGDVKQLDDGTYTTNSSLEQITQAIQGVAGSGIDWSEYVSRVTQPALLINARENYDDKAPILPEELALETIDLLQAGQYKAVSGNHLTMLYGEGAKQIAAAINDFVMAKDPQ